MLLDQEDLYGEQPPKVLRLTWEDFECHLSDENDAALGRMAEWSVMAYLAADCNLAKCLFDDLQELKSIGSNASMHVCALFDGPLLSDSFFARLNSGNRLGEDIVLRFNELKSSDPKVLTLGLRLASHFPAEQRVLFLGGHGDSWRGLLLDENIGLQYREQAGRLILPGPAAQCDARLVRCQQHVQNRLNETSVPAGLSSKKTYDILALDACYMGNLEVIATLAGFADILVVSEDVAPGEGYSYDHVLSHLRGDPAQTPLDLARYLVNHGGGHTTQVALACDRLPAFANAFVHLVQVLGSMLQSAAVFGAVRDALKTAHLFKATGTIDLKGFVMKLLEHPLPREVLQAGTDVLNRWSEMVLAAAVPGTADTANGLSIYAPPPEGFDVAYLKCSNGLDLNLGIWSWFLAACYLHILGAESPGHPLLRAMQDTMEDLRRKGICKPGQTN
ncbi:MAG TPA: clostripain-related cysteine peptidase [Chthoniobacterales bacterium]|nr:clostripain-related cysteine peptidase [Chthoniobacterales bacterium]